MTYMFLEKYVFQTKNTFCAKSRSVTPAKHRQKELSKKYLKFAVVLFIHGRFNPCPTIGFSKIAETLCEILNAVRNLH